MKWYEKIIILFLIILFSPLIIFLLICLCISLPFISISDHKAYKKSIYFKTFRIPYDKDIVNSNKYIFYNYAIHEKLPINYIIQTTNSFEYFIFENQVFIFPDFNEIKYNDIKQEYEVIYRKNNKELYICSLDEFLDKQMKLFEQNIELPLKILLSRNYFDEEYFDIDNLPDSIHIIKNYYNAFKEENKELLSIFPKSTKKLYEMMLKNDKLGGKFELKEDSVIVWTFEKVIYEIAIDEFDGYFCVFKNNKLHSSITHWHPNNYEIYDDVCNIGEKGNLLIIKSFFNSEQVLYMGKPGKCTFNKNKKHLGKIYYFESN